MYENIKKQLFQLKSNKIFEALVVAVIIISALEIGAKTYELPAFANSLTYGLDLFITLFFLIEITIRFIAEDNKKAFFKDGWNVFDTLVVLVSLIPINDSELALLARLVRIFRVLRMISIIPELRTLINSLLKALPQMGYVVLLMFIIFYIYAAVGSYLFADINPFLWDNIATSMLTLFRVMTFEDWTDIQYETMEVYGWSWIYYMTFIFLTAFAFLNMVIGIVINVMDKEGRKVELGQENEAQELGDKEPSITDLQQEIRELKQLILAQQDAERR
ncbi:MULTISPECIES: ion transporter [Idiomarina]|jgi:voltage-gated sodium channel|uniref:Ion transporter n=1 Tax=Idiomarina abyssalis TaxID=86102 RepID=A0A8I1G622_9GAMM|nr:MULTISPECIES: ion transporter [Idiomarina]MAO69055.1 ion transporter [Idiomarina sp.]MBF80813.1 ion transporter [Idiomarina sp.]MBJ7267253.1 ion transporter [Idiomarina abyssalis]MBJ7273593.1 ion transporter [Idiomarina abyssalis]MBJ7314736.1 ion transporter [Idiomarina abyssalis]|tara:strand:+ start:9231 stop:10058 length:828 start_codon:yes stop_codon:yes gene_type:complete